MTWPRRVEQTRKEVKKMKLVSSLADRMLTRVVPRVTAAAGIVCPEGYWVPCSACERLSSGGYITSAKLCRYSGNLCTLSCGSCVIVSGCI
jgi:hypothetical protein